MKLLFFGTVFIIVGVTHQTGYTYYIQEYILFTDLKLSWMKAQSYCRAVHTDLATVSNDEDISRINDMNYNMSFWIGLYDDVNSWRWSLLNEHFYTEEGQDYRQWQEGQPDNAGAVERCVSMMEDGFWRDNDCVQVKMPLICFRDDTDDQYVLVTEEQSWFEAQSYCRQYHTDLVSVRSQSENQEVLSRLQGNHTVQEAWIGLHRDAWKWSDGSRSLFRQWWDFQPDNENSSQACVAMQSGRWDDWNCDTKFNFLCQNITVVTMTPLPEPTTINPAGQRRTTVKMKLMTDSDLTDPTIRQKVLQQFEAALNFQGFTDVKLHWRTIKSEPQPTEAVNVALGGVAAQSSLWDPLYLPSLVIDGKPDSWYLSGSCVSTLIEDDPWWRVDIGEPYDISTVVVIGRSDCCIDMLEGAEIRIGNSLENNSNNNPRCAVNTLTSDHIMNFHCNQMRGRYVNVFLPGVNRRLQLCEVKVYATNHLTGADVARGGVAAQSSFWDNWHPSNVAIDGSPSTNYWHGSCVSTRTQWEPWWRLDLHGPYDISTVVIIRRTDCCGHYLNGAEIRIGNSLENNGNNNPRCAVITVSNDVTMTFNCSQMRGRYVNIFYPGERTLQLCELKVFATTHVTGDNVSLRGVATQSAEPTSASTTPDKAIDEHPGPSYPQETCASVSLQDNPWWQLDLKSIYRITVVSIISNGRSEELDGAEVRIGLRSNTSNQRCAIISVAEGLFKYSYNCGVMEGRFVHVVLPGLQKSLTICEVLVYGTVLENVALRGVAFQSSSRWKTGSEASRVIDGRQFSTCSRTEDKPGQWVTVDLLVPYTVTFIQLAYGEDCCYSDNVRVDDTSCDIIPSSSQSLVTLDCRGIVGRYVTVMHPDVPPQLCEVEVYSTQENFENRFPQRPPPDDHCSSCSRDYILIHNEPKTWFEAQTYCRERYTDLATVSNVRDMNRVVDKMENTFTDFWIGLYEDAVTWRWSMSDEGHYGDGEVEFRNWGDGKPTNESGIHHCAGIQHMGQWKDLDCDLLHYFLCFDGRSGAPETKILVATAMKWTDAQRYCREHHTDLLSVRNQAENLEIQSMVPAGKLAWIGLFMDSWKWSDGSYSTFRYWSSGPHNSSGEGPNCAHVYHRKWNVRSCDTESMFLCYYYKKRSVVKISINSDMSDPVIRQQILNQLEADMKRKGITDFKIRWLTSRRVSHKEAQQ
ncbi:hypothetical protein ABVT39_009345 [Epinephelus coioides]